MANTNTTKTLTPSSPPWLDLPPPLTEQILEHLPLSDYLRFAAICSHWRSIHSGHRLRNFHPLPLPLLTVGDFESPPLPNPPSSIPCFSPFEQKFYHLHSLPSSPSIILASQSSWLLIHDLTNPSPSIAFFSLFNPINGSHIPLPSLPAAIATTPNNRFDVTGAISFPPSNPNCHVIIIHQTDFYVFRFARSAWTKLTGPGPASSVVTVNGKFYCSCVHDVVVRVDPELSKPVLESFDLEDSGAEIPHGAVVNHIVEWNGEVVLIVILWAGEDPGRRITGVKLLKADFKNNVWVRVESLGEYVVLVGHNSSVSVKGKDVGVGRGDYVYITNPVYAIHWCNGGKWTPWMVLDLKTGKMTGGAVSMKLPKDDKSLFRKKLMSWFVPRDV